MKEEPIDTFANRLNYAIELRNITPTELCKVTGIDKSQISSWRSGRYKAKQKSITLLAKALHVNPVWLIGYDVQMNMQFDNLEGVNKTTNTKTVPIYGYVPAGIPIDCIQELIDTEEINVDNITSDKEYFGLKIKGDSMYPEYLNGDIIILEQINDCNSGDDCVVMVNGNDGTFKRIFKYKDGITLQPLNNAYEPVFYTNKEIKQLPVRIIGRVIELRRRKR